MILFSRFLTRHINTGSFVLHPIPNKEQSDDTGADISPLIVFHVFQSRGRQHMFI